jgi:endonuclease/exonuclease/phosphatase family metal-dependent hydrolase
MRWPYVVPPVVISAAVLAVSGRPDSAVSPQAATFRVATYNIHKGADRQGHYDLNRTIDTIAAFNADIVGLQETMRNHAESNCEDQPSLIAEGLRRRTGRPWTHTFVKASSTGNAECVQRGRGDGVETEGLAIFSSDRLVDTESVRLSETRIGLLARVASMRGLSVVVTHLTNGVQNQAARAHEIGGLLRWAESLGPGILMGDFNATPEANELAPLMSRYLDAWTEAHNVGLTRGVETGMTWAGRVGRRLDYVLYTSSAEVTLESADVIDTSTASGLGEVSDHRPLVVTFHRNGHRAPEAPARTH